MSARRLRGPSARGTLVAVVIALAAAIVFAGSARAQGTTRLVATTGSDTGDCTVSPCLTIAYAVSQASSGDTIQIASGTYDEAITTSTSLTFLGTGSSGAGRTLIDSTGLSGSALRVAGSASVTVEHLALETDDPGIGGALATQDAAAVAATDIAVSTAPAGNGSDGIQAAGASLSLTGATVSVTNSDAAIANTNSNSFVVQDGSGIEANAGTVSVQTSTIEVARGLALRIHGTTSSTTVRDSVLESSGIEDYTSGQADYVYDQWPVVEAASGQLALTGTTVYNASVGVVDSSSQQLAHTDALWVPGGTGVSVTNSILHTQPNANYSVYGADLNTAEPVTASDSAYTTLFVQSGTSGSAPAAGSDGNIVGDPGLSAPLSGDFALAAGAAAVGAGDAGAVQAGETDLAGNARALACSAGSLTNIGAYELAAPSCPAPLSSGDSTGKLAQLTGAFNCVSGASAASSGCGTATAPGLTGGTPTDVVQSADGQNVYVATEDPSGDGVDIAEFSRGAGGGLTQLAAPDNCVGSSAGPVSGCGNQTGDPALQYQLNFANQPAVEPTRMAISPDGNSLYVDNGSTVAEFARDPSTGALTPLASSDCVTQESSGTACAFTRQFQIGPAAALVVSPDGRSVYLATLNQCYFSLGGPRGRAGVRLAAASSPPGDNQNLNCNNQRPATEAVADVALLRRDPSTGVLTPTACYDNTTYSGNSCTGGFDGLYWMTSMALSPDGKQLYITSEVGSPGQGALSRDPGEITELAIAGDGTLSQITGVGACVTAGTGCGNAGDPGIQNVPGVADPQQIVLSPDGLNAYVTGAQYLETTSSNGALVGSTLAQLARDPTTGELAPIAGATCFAGYHEACETAGGPAANVTPVPALTGAEALAISPDGQSVYTTAQNTGVDSAVVELSRDLATGQLTPLSTPDLCLSNGTPPGAATPYDCGSTATAGLSGSVAALPGGVLVAPGCDSALVMSGALVEFSRSVPAGASGCGGSAATPPPPPAPAAGEPAVSLDSAGLAFEAAPGTTSAAQSVTVTNTGTGDLVFGAGALTLAGSGAADFKLAGDGCSGHTLAPSGTCSFAVAFSAPAAGSFGAQVLLADNASTSPQALPLRGTGTSSGIEFSPTQLAFGSGGEIIVAGASEAKSIEIFDSGQAPLNIGRLALGGSGAAPFSITADGCSDTALAPNGSCTVQITFAPGSPGTFEAQLTVPDDAPGNPQAVSLTGLALPLSLFGHVTAGGQPVAGADVYACPQGQLQSASCKDTSSAHDGLYQFAHLAAGEWVLQVSAPGNLFPASGVIAIADGRGQQLDFALHAPSGLSRGVTFVTPSNGTVSAGIPLVNWTVPFAFAVPLAIPAVQAPGSTLLFTDTAGVGSSAGTLGGHGYAIAGMLLFAVHYGGDGRPQGMSAPMVGQIDCNTAPAACAAMTGAGQADGVARGVAFSRGASGALDVATQTPAGTPVSVTVGQLSFPGLAATGNPLSAAVLSISDGGGGGGGSSAYDALVGELSRLAADPRANAAQARALSGGAGRLAVNVGTLNAHVHGGATFFNFAGAGTLLAGELPSDLGSGAAELYPPDGPLTAPGLALIDAAVRQALGASQLTKDQTASAEAQLDAGAESAFGKAGTDVSGALAQVAGLAGSLFAGAARGSERRARRPAVDSSTIDTAIVTLATELAQEGDIQNINSAVAQLTSQLGAAGDAAAAQAALADIGQIAGAMPAIGAPVDTTMSGIGELIGGLVESGGPSATTTLSDVGQLLGSLGHSSDLASLDSTLGSLGNVLGSVTPGVSAGQLQGQLSQLGAELGHGDNASVLQATLSDLGQLAGGATASLPGLENVFGGAGQIVGSLAGAPAAGDLSGALAGFGQLAGGAGAGQLSSGLAGLGSVLGGAAQGSAAQAAGDGLGALGNLLGGVAQSGAGTSSALGDLGQLVGGLAKGESPAQLSGTVGALAGSLDQGGGQAVVQAIAGVQGLVAAAQTGQALSIMTSSVSDLGQIAGSGGSLQNAQEVLGGVGSLLGGFGATATPAGEAGTLASLGALLGSAGGGASTDVLAAQAGSLAGGIGPSGPALQNVLGGLGALLGASAEGASPGGEQAALDGVGKLLGDAIGGGAGQDAQSGLEALGAQLGALDGAGATSLDASIGDLGQLVADLATSGYLGDLQQSDQSNDLSGDLYIDPSGLVESTRGVPLARAKVVLARAATKHGRLSSVRHGSLIMSPANRRNPDHSNLLGQFGWDTLPGYYRISATHAGCRAARGRSSVARTRVFAVPPPRRNLVLRLRCPHLRRSATRLRLRIARGRLGALVVSVAVRRRRGRARPRTLVGVVEIRAGRRRPSLLALDPRTGSATVTLPPGASVRKLSARFLGNGLYAPSVARR